MISINLPNLLMAAMAGGMAAAWLLESWAIQRDEQDDLSRWSADRNSS